MRKTLRMASLALLLVFGLIAFMPPPRTASAQTLGTLEIDGDVTTPLSLTYAELLSLPMVSEVAELRCVTGSPDVTYNWTGIPLFYLLTLAQIKPDAYKVVTRCSDGYSSDLLVEDALKPTTILALEANGASLPHLTYGPAGPNRLTVPGKYGYKWSSGVQEIEVVTTNYKGEWESSGYSDEADVPNYGPMPTPTPSVQTLDLPYGNRTFQVGAFTNASNIVSTLDPSQKALNLNVTVPQGTSGFADLILQQDFLSRPYNITLDGNSVGTIEADTNTSSYVYLAFAGGFHTVSIMGTEFVHIPEPIVYYSATANVGQNVTFDASKSVDVGRIVSYEWSFGDGINGTGAVVSHVYADEGTYQVQLNVTNNNGMSNSKTFAITVGSPSGYVLLLLKVILAAMLVALASIFAFLLRKRRVSRLPSDGDSKSSSRALQAINVRNSPTRERTSRFWLRALLNAIPKRNRGSAIKYSDVCRVFPSSLEDEAQTEKDEGNKTQLEREYELAR
ncbi:MAG TPA: molybdopterin-dependent oxidoreductase [candidate division Zixibacteria bacterium]|nr:molybdopterin-dependent oxidoreductase [candidate division Zixibacteria bacterium]